VVDDTSAARRPLPQRRDLGGASFAGRLARFFALAFRQTNEDSVLLTASALAFVTVLSIIPVLAASSLVGTRVFSQYQQRTLEVFVQVLPYSEKSVVEKIGEFLDQAETIHGFGVLAFFATTLLLFSTVEEALNRIWNVSRRRPFKLRLLSFVLLLFWGPLLLGATFSSLFALRQSPALRVLFEESILLNVLPFLGIIVGLTTLYWIVPYTTVQFRNALAGGLVAAILLEMLRQGFGSYVEFFRNVNAVYGSFAFVLLFMVSLELTWTIILFGSEVSYTAQHFGILARGLHRHPPVQAAWVGLAAVVLIARRFARGEPFLTRRALADRLSLTLQEVERILHPLLGAGLLRPLGNEGYLLGTDPHQLPVERVLAAYDHRARRGAELVGGEICEHLEELIGDLARARAERLGPLTVADLLAPRPAPASPAAEKPELAETHPPE
jgi:membrane protein